MSKRTEKISFAVVVSLVGVVFVLDLATPKVVLPPVLYVSAVAACLWLPSRRQVMAFAALVSILTIVGYLLSPSVGLPIWIPLLNRAFALLAIWIIAAFVLLHKRAQERIQTLQTLLPVCASCKNIRGINGAWNPIERYLEVLSKAVITHSICPACVERWYPELYPELAERYPELYKDKA